MTHGLRNGWKIAGKGILVALWNGAWRSARFCRDYAGIVRRDRWIRCDVCGRRGFVKFEPLVIPGRLAKMWGLTRAERRAFAEKESLTCRRCGANTRARRLASALMHIHPGSGSSNLSQWVRTPDASRLTIAEINGIAGIHEIMTQHPGLAYSEFAPDPNRPDIARQDLTALDYPNEHFDLVLTSETLEHVPDLDRALAEIHRVLKPGGWHLCTIPIRPNVPVTRPRALLAPNGLMVDNMHPRLHHPGGDVGYPVFTEFGRDAPDLFTRAGFVTEVFFGPLTEHNVAQVYACRKTNPT